MNHILKVTLPVLTIIASSSGAWADTPSSSESKPNIIFILTDDQGYGDLGRHGHPLLKTPNTDRLYDESVRFDHFYVSPSCSPTRAALMTGMHEFRSGVTHTIQPREHLYKQATILPQLLKTAGYKTGFIGKWHLGTGAGYSPGNRGFDWTSTNAGGPRVHMDPVMIRNGKREKATGFREDLFFDDAMTFIDQSRDQPFFCYLATYSPHTPLSAPEKYVKPYRVEGISEDQATYLGMIANIDYNVGRLLDFLKDRKLEENTILIFMNDNGVTVGLDVYNANMRGSKCTIWEGGSRAMSFWRWPHQWKPHQVNNLTAHIDVLPTLCHLAGAQIPKEIAVKLDGFNLTPLLESTEPMIWNTDRLLFHHVARWPGGLAASHKYAMAGVRQGDYLLLRSNSCDDPECKNHTSQCTTMNKVQSGGIRATYTEKNAAFHWGVTPKGKWVLINTKNDPACKNDLSSTKPELVAQLAKAYDQWWDKTYPQMIEAGGDKKTTTKAPRRSPNPKK